MPDNFDKEFIQQMPKDEQMAKEQAEMRNISEDELEEGLETTRVKCNPAKNSGRFMDCKVMQDGIERNVERKIDAVNVDVESSIEDDKSIRTTRAAESFKMSTESHMGEPKPQESFEVESGICRDTQNTSSGRFCTLNIEAE